MLVRGFALATVLLAAGSAGAAAIDAGLVAVEAEVEPVPHCSLAAGDVCLARWDDDGSAGVGDDRVLVATVIRELRATLRPPAGPAADIAIDPSDLRLEHPAFRALNATWVRVNDSLPAEAKAFVTLDSRPLRAEESASWGVFATPHLPATVETPVTGQVGLWDVGACWDLNACPAAWQGNTLFASDDGTLLLFPNDVWLRAWDTDAFLNGGVEGAATCTPGLMSDATCEVLRAAGDAGLLVVGVIEGEVPTGQTEFQLQQAAILIRPSGEARLGPASGLRGQTEDAEGRATAERPQRASASAAPTSDPFGAAPAGAAPLLHGEGPPALLATAGPVETLGSAGEGLMLAAAAVALGAALALYHRIARSRALEQDTRRRVFECIRQHPGVRVGSIAGRLGLAHNTALHHARILLEAGLVEAIGDGQRRFFARERGLGAEHKRAAIASATPVATVVLSFLEARREVEFATLRNELGLPKSSASEAVARLAQAGLLSKRREGGRLLVAHRPRCGEAADETTA